MRAILHFFVRQRFFASLMLLMICLTGIASLFNINLQELPASKQGETAIITDYPGVSAEEIELEITNRIEKELKSVQGLGWYMSTSVDGRSEIEIRIRDGENIDRVNQAIRDAVDRVAGLPADLESAPLVEPENTATFEFMTLGLSGDMPFAQLRESARQIEKKLRTIPGIGKISSTAFPQREFIVSLIPDRLQAYGLTPEAVVNAISTRNVSSSGGVVESWQAEQNLLTLTQVESVAELSDVIVSLLPGGGAVRLSNVATVSDGFERQTQRFMVNGKSGIGFTLYKTESGDTLKTVAGVKRLLAEEQERSNGRLTFDWSLDLAEEIDARFQVVRNNGVIGIALVLMVLFITMQRRLAPWITASLPVCVFGTVTMLLLFGYSLDSVTLSAILLIIGIIVDDSIVVSESIDQAWQQGLTAADAAVEGYMQVFKPVITSLLTTLLVFLPMLFMGGDFGATFAVLPLTVIMALLMSLLDVTFLLPAHLAHSLEKGKKSKVNSAGQQTRGHWFDHCKRSYRSLLKQALRFRYVVVPVFVITAGTVLYTGYRQLDLDFYPTGAARLIEFSLEVADGTPLNTVHTINKPFVELLSNTPEVARFHMTEGAPESTGLIILTPVNERSRGADDIAEYLEESASGFAGLKAVHVKVDAGGPPPPDPIEFRIFGSNDDSRARLAQDLMHWLAQQSGTSDLENTNENLRPQTLIKPDYAWLARLGLTVDDLNNSLTLAFEGREASTSWLGDDEVKIKVWLDTPYRQSTYLPNIDIPAANGEAVPLRQVAEVATVMTPREITHWNGDRNTYVVGDLDDEVQNSAKLSQDALKHFLAIADQYPGVRLEAGGEAEMTQDALGGLLGAVAIALVGIWVVIALLFGSLLQPLMIMLIIPFAVASAVFALMIHGEPMSFFAGIGILGLCGVVVNNALVMVDRLNRPSAGEDNSEFVEHMIESATTRLRPVLLTTVTTVSGLLPLAYGLGGSDVYMGPMALTLGYGLLLTVPAVLFFLPCCYLMFREMTFFSHGRD
ncbi:efflux RND transporter permease subunit [Endozoicomonas sp.]|uniref:efflux RND transporter permease subunit n=1 Tax=Endozoicomonas sp. TaxID=1892382 RepID=UPI00383AE3BF